MFNYQNAFSRNLGLVTEQEQEILKRKKVAIAGAGGVGGGHALTLARMGIMHFHIADLDAFEEGNFNRQVGAEIDTIGHQKAQTIKNKILKINPDAEVTLFETGVTFDNMDDFLKGTDIYIDGLDFFVFDIRAEMFKRCRDKGIYAITAAPLALAPSLLIFAPNGMRFDDYFQFKGKTDIEKAICFLVGLSPKLLHRKHIVDPSYIDLKQKRGPSLMPACAACSAMVGSEVLKIFLKRGKIQPVPWHSQFDMYQNKYHKTYNFMGNKNPLNRMKIKLVKKMMLPDVAVLPETELCAE